MSNDLHDDGLIPVTDDSIRVLHVDDDPGLAEIVAEFLQRDTDRIDVVTEIRPLDALERLRTEEIDCIVTDYQMPEMNGIEFIRAIREEYDDLPCIIYTGQGSEEVASDAISAGATDYLQKQSGTEHYELLVNRIENAVESYRAERRAGALEQIRTVARKVNQALIRTSSREEIERRVCDILADAEGYKAAWVGEVDPDTLRIEPRTTAGIEGEFFDAVTLTAADRPGGQSVAGKAVRDQRITIVDDVGTDLQDERLRGVALDYDVRAIAAIPLSYGDELYGPLVVYSDRPGTFDAAQRDLLTELAGDVAYAINAVQMRTTLREERDRRAALFENAPNPIAEFTFDDRSPTIESINAAFTETFGFEVDEVTDRSVGELLVPRDGRAEYEDIVDRAANGDVVETTVERQTVDGVRTFLLTVNPIALDGSSGGYAWFIDITDRRELEAELQERANLMDHIFGQIPTALYVKDTEGRHVRISDYDVEPDEVYGKTDPEIYGETEFTEETLADDMRVIEDGETIINKEEYNPWNGEWSLTSKVPWYGDDGEVKGLIGVSRLITEKKENERELERKNERLENFANVVSHDLRNPLNVAMGQLELVRDDVDHPRLGPIGEALDRMDALIADILTLAQQGWTVEDPVVVALSPTFDRAWASVETPGATKHVDSDCRFRADGQRLLQLFENLVHNAVEHGGEGVTVRVGALENGFYVADDGPGIAEVGRDDIFEPGYTTTENGIGFGLAIVREIAESHGWDVAVTDSDEGGARFEFTGVDVVE